MDFLFLFLFCSSRLSNQLSKLYTQMTVGDLKKKKNNRHIHTHTDRQHALFCVCVFRIITIILSKTGVAINF